VKASKRFALGKGFFNLLHQLAADVMALVVRVDNHPAHIRSALAGLAAHRANDFVVDHGLDVDRPVKVVLQFFQRLLQGRQIFVVVNFRLALAGGLLQARISGALLFSARR